MAGFSARTFADRRARILGGLGDGVMVLPAAPVRYRSRDTEYRYRPDAELFYATGAAEPDTVAVLVGGDEPRFVLFVPARDETVELWSGPRPDPEEAAERYAPDEALPLEELETRLPDLLASADRIHVRVGADPRVDRLVREALGRARARGPRTGTGPRGLTDPGEILDDLRLVKDQEELRRIREAARISMEGHRAGMAAGRPGAGEWVVEAAVEGAFRTAGATGAGFGTIVGSGANSCVLHYVANADTVEAASLVLVDAGAEVGLYHGDITRSWPVDGRFTGRQRAVYEVVEAARAAGVAAVAPGASVAEVHDAAVAVIVEGLVEMGVLEGAVEELVAEEAHRPFFPHQTSHWLGLDVHDPGDYARQGESRRLEPGMVLTVEPGLYFRPGLAESGEWAAIGVRVEDDVLVTEDGRENLTAELPTDPDEVAALVGGG
jgi:Xaa-Pro aminopeptidase